MSNAKTYSPLVIELHNRDIKFQQYDLKNVDLFGKGNLNQNGSSLKNKQKTFPVLNIPNNANIKGIFRLPKVKWDDDVTTMGAGLNNPGINICYMNVIIQVLTHTPFMASALIKSYHTKTCLNHENNVFCIMCLFENYVKESFSSPNPLNNPFYGIAKKFIWSRFKLGHQDDAFIFLKHFLDSLSKACYLNSQKSGESNKSENTSTLPKDFISNDKIMSTVIGRLFGGYFRNVIICDNCSLKSEKVEEFFDLDVEITKSNKLIDLLSEFVLPEKLSNDNKYFCSKCKSLQDASKSLSIYKAPRILNINLKRFNLYSSVYKKSLKPIDFPQMLSISLKSTEDAYTWLNYELYAIVCHIGKSLHMGHYITFIKGKHGFWYCFDDSRIQSVSESKVLSHKSDVYLLFYSINNESVKDCDTVLNKFSYTNVFNECPYSYTDSTVENEVYESRPSEEVEILSNFHSNSILRKFLKHKKFKNYKLLNMRLFSNVYRLNFLKKKIKSIHRVRLNNNVDHFNTQLNDLNDFNYNNNHYTHNSNDNDTSNTTNTSDSNSNTDDDSNDNGNNYVMDNNTNNNRDSNNNNTNSSNNTYNNNETRSNNKTQTEQELECSFKNPTLQEILNQSEEVEVWSDAEDLDTYNKLFNQMQRELPKPDEQDVDYDRGKVPKFKTNSLNNSDNNTSNLELMNHSSGVSIAVNQKNLFDNPGNQAKSVKKNFKKHSNKKHKKKGVICQIRAGKCVLNDKLVSPDLRKGSLRLFRGDDDLLSVQWLTRDDSNVEDTLYIFDDAYLEKVPQCDTGNVYVLKFTSSNHRSFYWMQETNVTMIKSFVDCFNMNTGYTKE